MASLNDLVTEIQAEFPDFKVVPKSESKLMSAIDAFLKAASFGGMKDFMVRYTTTLGHTVYTGSGWDDTSEVSKLITLRHERVHMRQQQRYGRILFSLLYLLAFLPVGLAWFRARFEMEAYAESMRAEVEYRGTGRVWSPEYQNWLVSQFTGPGYLWMFPFKNVVYGWIREAADRAVDEYVGYEPKAKK